MTAVTRSTAEQPSVRVARTGWALARRPRAGRVRTCVAAFVDRDAPAAPPAGTEQNIVRGAD
ncbi:MULTISPECIES: hypothetical protein [Streptomyces]|uniref:Uncharacterized protein n=1 Tax=Streptomyces doudnae TaxID=3075536 RepID=A0ABD5EXV0_9ACTN|nr:MULTISPECIES: hypothetical protein [unclassified Streptomyces]MDT0439140.1 hypothetical protein [Streptomyces sp. DSM 41981]MYQ63751.1 hypothetical protein [Streptomyces sp. SID4950]SCD64592.1 hypothetical protein GA0115242_110932 [Streptomyces sp. SolWspMP-5a-2]